MRFLILVFLTVGVLVGQGLWMKKEKRLWRLCRSASRRLGQAQQNKRPQRDQAGDMDADEPTELLVDLLPQFAALCVDLLLQFAALCVDFLPQFAALLGNGLLNAVQTGVGLAALLNELLGHAF